MGDQMHSRSSLDRIKESLRMKFADLANDFQKRVYGISTELSAIEGPLEVRYHARFFSAFIIYDPRLNNLLLQHLGAAISGRLSSETNTWPYRSARRRGERRGGMHGGECRRERLYRIHVPGSRVRTGVNCSKHREEDRVH